MLNTKVLILAGGQGKRLWPLSRKRWPKFMLELKENKSLLQLAYERLDSISGKDDRYVVTTKDVDFLIERNIRAVNRDFSKDNVIIEPASRNTAPAIMRGINDFKDDEIVVVLPADHIIEPKSEFTDTIEKAIEVAGRDFIVTVGIKPDKPSTAYGYIKKSEKSAGSGWEVEEFKEKPDKKTAEDYLQSGGYFWNGGIFVFKAGVMKEEMKKHCSEIYSPFTQISEREEIAKIYKDLPNISIDYAVMEKSDRVAVVGYEGDWSDLGSWEAVKTFLSKDNEIFVNGESLNIDGSNSMVFSKPRKFTATIGLEDVIAIDTEDALLVMKDGEGQKVKDVVNRLDDKSEVVYPTADSRPWGWYKVIDQGKGFKVKTIMISPGHRLSLQKHKHRKERWTVITGKGLVTLNEEKKEVTQGDSVQIASGVEHRLENIGENKLKILELATGEKILEDDIQRLEDDYDRQ
ncbi:MAG: mannose-1-phosphate guanylyltransferase/mannose-6-phosphate isomerase [Elusimicrobiota bacterium]